MRRPIAAVAAAVCAAVLLAGCTSGADDGGDRHGESVSPSPGQTGAAPTTAPDDKVRGFSSDAKLYAPEPAADIQKAVDAVKKSDAADGRKLQQMIDTPHAVWLNGGDESHVYQQVHQAVTAAAAQNAVPVFVAYNVPGRDCGDYSAGGAKDNAEYSGWIGSLASAIGDAHAVVILEPDSLGLLPSACDHPDKSIDDDSRYQALGEAVRRLEKQQHTAVYLDGTNSNWLPVGTAAERLAKAGVAEAQGFFLNVSNFESTDDQLRYGRWVSECLAYVAAGRGGYSDCANQFHSASDQRAAQTDAWYRANTTGLKAETHFVIDTSRNGRPVSDMTQYGSGTKYGQSADVVKTLRAGRWCNPPGAGLGAQPQVAPSALVDAYLWVKTPGVSDGRCDAAGGARAWDYSAYSASGWPTTPAAQRTFDPLWGVEDPPAGTWFTKAALGLVRNAAQG